MKKLIATAVLGMGLLIASPAMAYEVKKGDTMYGIATLYEMPLSELAEMNPQINDLNKIYVGQTVNTKEGKQATGSHSETPEASESPSNADKPEEAKVAPVASQDLLARLVNAEARGESYQGKVAVAEVVLNRVASNQFPDTVAGVIYQPNQFSPVTNGSIHQPATAQDVKAVQEAVATEGSIVSDSVFFYNSATASSRWLDTRPTVAVIGNHTFKK